MSSFLNTTKTSAFTATNATKNAANPAILYKQGGAWLYDDPNITYNDDLTDDGKIVYYESAGQAPSWSNIAKS